MFSGSSPFSDSVDTTFLAITAVSLVVFLGLVTAMVYFVMRYNRKKNPHPTNIEGHIPLELTWTIVPLVLFMGMFYMGWRGYLLEFDIPDHAVPIKVTAQMWKWTFEYPNGVQTDTLYVPMNTPIKCILHSVDVNHSFYIPSFRIKKDVIPNRENIMWFKTVRKAAYDIACAEYCGLNHSYMYTKVISLDSTGFDQWYRMISIQQSKPILPFISAVKQPD
ncbi:MAG: cytochrome c oxidase subunit II [Ignavibacteriae bacterium]|nr:MAG: cytochrome c oxidase subunit II [Ignavibacteriota bacterium]